MWPAGTFAPWPAEQDDWHREHNRPQRDEFHICPACCRKAILAYVSGEGRKLALLSARRWQARTAILEDTRHVLDGAAQQIWREQHGGAALAERIYSAVPITSAAAGSESRCAGHPQRAGRAHRCIPPE
jgi:hypothetical protein